MNAPNIPNIPKGMDPKEIEEAKGMAETASTVGSASDAGGMVGSFLSPGDPTSMSVGAIAKMLQYIKYMNVNFPAKVQVAFASQESDTGMNADVKRGLSKIFYYRQLPDKFGLYKAHSSFVVNLWQSLLILFAIYGVTVLLLFISKITKKDSKVNSLTMKILPALKWNVFLVVFCGSYGDIVFFSALEFKSLNIDNFASFLSFILCFAINGLALYIFAKIILVNLMRKKNLKTQTLNNRQDNTQTYLEEYKAFFECYKDKSFDQQLFLAIYILRVSSFNIIIAYGFKSPVTQAIFIFLINIAMVAYLVIKRPMKKLINLLQQLSIELVLIVFNLCLLILAFADNANNDSIDLRNDIGEVMMMINLIAPIVSMGLIVIKIILIAWEFYQEYKQAKAIKIMKPSQTNKLNIQKVNRSGINQNSPEELTHGTESQDIILMTNPTKTSNQPNTNPNPQTHKKPKRSLPKTNSLNKPTHSGISPPRTYSQSNKKNSQPNTKTHSQSHIHNRLRNIPSINF